MVKVNAIMQAELIRLLLEGTYTCAELAELSGAHYVTVLHYCRELHKRGAAHICMWDKDKRGRDLVKIYKIGNAPDAKRKKASAADRQRRYREKKKAAEMAQVMAGNGSYEARDNGRVAFKVSE